MLKRQAMQNQWHAFGYTPVACKDNLLPVALSYHMFFLGFCATSEHVTESVT